MAGQSGAARTRVTRSVRVRVRVHVWVQAEGEDELGQFEGALALTNIASLGEAAKEHIVRARGWAHMESLAASTNPQARLNPTPFATRLSPLPRDSALYIGMIVFEGLRDF